MSDWTRAGEALGNVRPFQHPQAQREGGDMVVFITKAGQTLYLTPREAAEAGYLCTGAGDQRICRSRVFRDGETDVYPPPHQHDDLDGSIYRQEYEDRVEGRFRAMKDRKKRQGSQRDTFREGFA